MIGISSRAPGDLDIEELLRDLARLSPRAAHHKVFAAIAHVDPYELGDIVLKRKPFPAEASARALIRNLGKLLDLRANDVAAILDVSPSRVSRNDKVSVPMLDRAYSISGVFTHVSAVLGPENAQAWFKAPNPALDNEAPYKLLGTSYGEKKVENLVVALLNGAVV